MKVWTKNYKIDKLWSKSWLVNVWKGFVTKLLKPILTFNEIDIIPHTYLVSLSRDNHTCTWECTKFILILDPTGGPWKINHIQENKKKKDGKKKVNKSKDTIILQSLW